MELLDSTESVFSITFVNNRFDQWQVGDQIRFYKVSRNKHDHNSLSFDFDSSFELNKNLEMINWYKDRKASDHVDQRKLIDILKDDDQLRLTNL